MSKWEYFFGRKFKNAFKRGALGASFDKNVLPHGGSDSLADHVARSAFRVFKNNCLTLPWVREGEEIDASVQGARADLLRSWNAYRQSPRSPRAAAQAEADWRQVLSAFRRHVADINRRIAAYNLKAPSADFRRQPVDAEQEIGKVINDSQS